MGAIESRPFLDGRQINVAVSKRFRLYILTKRGRTLLDVLLQCVMLLLDCAVVRLYVLHHGSGEYLGLCATGLSQPQDGILEMLVSANGIQRLRDLIFDDVQRFFLVGKDQDRLVPEHGVTHDRCNRMALAGPRRPFYRHISAFFFAQREQDLPLLAIERYRTLVDKTVRYGQRIPLVGDFCRNGRRVLMDEIIDEAAKAGGKRRIRTVREKLEDLLVVVEQRLI